MAFDGIPSLVIGNLEINPPIIQGGMGVRVSGAGLAAAVANTGCVGVIASTGLGRADEYRSGANFETLNEKALREEIQKARAATDGIIGVNIMVALSDYDRLVAAAVDEGVDMIISGAGLPMSLPDHLNGKDVKLVPVVSSKRTFQIICKRWKNRYDKAPDAVIVEGPEAGGHLGFLPDEVKTDTAATLEDIFKEVLDFANTFSPAIPVIPAGGIFSGADIAKYLKMGAKGVQVASRFVCTEECDVHQNFKQAYLDAKEGDTEIIDSPVGLPGRVIRNEFVEKVQNGLTVPFKCKYRCLRSCDPSKAPYCIAEVLARAADGDLDNSFAFAGSNAWRCDQIVPVATLVDQMKSELSAALAAEQGD